MHPHSLSADEQSSQAALSSASGAMVGEPSMQRSVGDALLKASCAGM